MTSDIQDKLQRAVDGELVLRDQEGVIFWVDTFDEDGAYIHSGTGRDPQRVTAEQINEIFEFVDADREEV